MIFTAEQLAQMQQEAAARTYEVYQIRLAARTNNTWSEHHPDNIRKRIAAEQALLNVALAE